jgi:haloacetate dehalogenase
MFDGFALDHLDVGDVTLRVRRGGDGPPVVLLHGHPRTHATWHRVAPLLAPHHTVICPDLRGYGRSTAPADAPGHAQASKRAMAGDVVALMRALGHERFAVVGHDRGALAAFRTAMDHPDAVSKLVIMDGTPVVEALERADLRAALHDPAVVHGMCEDYRAGLGIDREHDEADRAAGRQVMCPMLLLWATRDDMEEIYGDPVAVWRPWVAGGLQGAPIASGHHQAEEAPEALAAALLGFL